MTRQLLDSQGPLTKKNPGEFKELVEEFAKHSREYHNPRNEGVKGVGSTHYEEMDWKEVEEKRTSLYQQYVHHLWLATLLRKFHHPKLKDLKHGEESWEFLRRQTLDLLFHLSLIHI